MSRVVDSEFPPQLRERLLNEIRSYLPAFLHRGASEQPDPPGDVRELLNLEPKALRRVLAVHECLDEQILAFADDLIEALRTPRAATERPSEVWQSVRGPVDWAATVARRSLEAGNRSLFVVRGAERVFDTPENRALVWLIERLDASTRVALPELRRTDPEELAEKQVEEWIAKIHGLAGKVRAARRVAWLRGVRSEPPTVRTLARLRASRHPFHATRLAPAAARALEFSDLSPEVIAEVLSRRYFEPRRNWLIFEVFVALSLAAAFREATGGEPRKTRLLVGGGRAAFAGYSCQDGGEIALIYQAWPGLGGKSVREETGERHGLSAGPKRPDLFIVRTGPDRETVEDVAVLELKASFRDAHLADGLSQLLAYLGEKPGLWRRRPAGWLVAPASNRFRDIAADPESGLWIVSAEHVAEAAVARFMPSAA